MTMLTELSTQELDLVSGGGHRHGGDDYRQYSIGSYNGNHNTVTVSGDSSGTGGNGNSVAIGNGNGINLFL